MEQVLIIDGHSAIFAWPELRELHGRNTALARRELISMLTHYQDSVGGHVVVVFDGKGRKTDSEGRKDGNILVMYSRKGETADTVIEKLVARQSGRMRITVASNDRAELDAVSAFGGECIGLKTLGEMVASASSDHRQRWNY